MHRPDLTEDKIAELAAKWVKGDKEAFSVLYDYFVENLYRFIFFKVNSAEAEDLTELTFIKAWEARKRYNSRKSSFSSWLYTIARNTVIDHYRVYKRSAELGEGEIDHSRESDPKTLAEEALTSEKLKKAIYKLPENFRDTLLLRFIEDLEYAEIADVLGKTEGAIRIMQFRAIRELKKVLADMGFHE